MLDKVTTLTIKSEKIKDNSKLLNIDKELKELSLIMKNKLKIDQKNSLFKKLKEVNLKLWDIEDKIRIKERKKNLIQNL